MDTTIIVKSNGILEGEYEAPPSKSHTFRALILSMHSKESYLKNLLLSDDVDNFVDIIKSLGFTVGKRNDDEVYKKFKRSS